MTENTYRTFIFDGEHRHFGGMVYPSDFQTNCKREENRKGSPIASRIEADLRRENQSLHNERRNYFA